jgi:hypothetical protein
MSESNFFRRLSEAEKTAELIETKTSKPDIEIRVVYHDTQIDEATGERRAIEIPVAREDLIEISSWTHSDGTQTRVLQPRDDVPKTLTASASENTERQGRNATDTSVPNSDVSERQK